MQAFDNSSIRADTVASIYHAGSGHPGGALSCVDILAVLFGVNSSNKLFEPKKDRFVLSKGHACPALYAVAAHLGWIPKTDIPLLRKLGSPLQGHPDVGTTPWVETSTGSLGQGFSVAVGMAMGFRHRNDAARTYVVVGDGELQEGEIWEGAMCAAHYKLHNLCAIVDYNKLQSDNSNENIIGLEPLRAKWEAFNWKVLEVDGHNPQQINQAFISAEASCDAPTVVIAHTVKGKGVSFMEGVPAWHGSVKLRTTELELALHDLGVPEKYIPAYIDGSIWRLKS